jgi:hypothetical protein
VPPATSRITVFRVSQVTVRGDGISVTNVVQKIITKTGANSESTAPRHIITDITPLAIINNAFRGTKRGTALVAFCGSVPDRFRDIANVGEDEVEVDDGDTTLSMDVDTGFLGTTQLYEPPSGTEHTAE